jgi:hypothetical protein
MDASTHTAFVLERQRSADLARERALLASHREHREALGGPAAAPRRSRAGWFRLAPAPAPAPACDPACLALAGPSA